MGFVRNMRTKMEARSKARAEAAAERARVQAAEARARAEARQREIDEARRAKALRLRQQRLILEILDDGKVPEISFSGEGSEIPFRFMKSEYPLYIFPQVAYLEKRVKREIKGRSAGTSVRVMKGVSVRLGQSKGTPVETDVIENRGIGILGITTKHLYFHGDRIFRIRFDKIVSIERADQNVVGVTRDRVKALPEYFVLPEEDTEFAYELMQMVASLDLGRSKPEMAQVEEYMDESRDDLGLHFVADMTS